MLSHCYQPLWTVRYHVIALLSTTVISHCYQPLLSVTIHDITLLSIPKLPVISHYSWYHTVINSKVMINFLVGKYIIYQPGQYLRPQVTPSLSHDIELRNCPSWNIAHIPRAGAASGLHRPSGCARYFIRDNSFVQYRSNRTVINHSGLAALVVDNSAITSEIALLSTTRA